MEASNYIENFLNLTLSLINPGLFKQGLDMLHQLHQLDTTKEITQQWQSVYTGISIICNHRTPFHQDSKGRPEWYDTLVSHSACGTQPLLSIRDLGLDLNYASGTVCELLWHHPRTSGIILGCQRQDLLCSFYVGIGEENIGCFSCRVGKAGNLSF